MQQTFTLIITYMIYENHIWTQKATSKHNLECIFTTDSNDTDEKHKHSPELSDLLWYITGDVTMTSNTSCSQSMLIMSNDILVTITKYH